MRLGRNGEIIAETGFDGGSYTPRYESRTSVYLGDMSREDIRIKQQVDARNRAVAKQNAIAAAAQRRAAQERYLIQDNMKKEIARREATSDRMLEIARAKGFEAALRSGKSPEINPWLGSPHAGFGCVGEQRINPDSNVDVEIVDANMPSVQEYGINNWMEDPSAIKTRVASAQEAWTDGKQTLQTMVDYARSPELSVVGMPLASQVSVDLSNAEAAVAPAVQGSPAIRYGLYALAAWLLFK